MIFQIQSNLDIQLSFFQLFPGVARKNHPLKTMRIVSLKRGGKVFLRLISKCLLASFSSCLGICSLAMPIQYNLHLTSQGQQQYTNCVLLQHRPLQHGSIISSSCCSFSRQLPGSSFAVNSQICEELL